MECWYDTLFECDCQGIYAMIAVPCSGYYTTVGYYRNPTGAIVGGTTFKDEKLFKRVRWIASCAAIASFQIVLYDDLRGSMFKVFLEALALRIYPYPDMPYYWETHDLDPHVCYYLGKSPFYWDYKYGMPFTPLGGYYYPIPIKADLLPSTLEFKPKPPDDPIQPFPMTRSVYTNEYLPLNIYTREDIEFFHGKAALQNMDRQSAFIIERKRILEECIKQQCLKKYPALGG